MSEIPGDLQSRYKVAKAQLGLLPLRGDEEDKWEGTRYQCEEVIEFIERIARAEARVAALEAENGRLKAPVTDDDYMCMFLAMNAVNKEPGKPIRGMEVFNAILAARTQQPSPAQDKVQG